MNNKEKNKNLGEKETDNRTFSEKAEDVVEEVIENVQDVVYFGSGDDYQNDIPATIEKPNGFRKVVKVQTRKNFNRRFFGKKGFIILISIILIGLAITGIYYLLNYLLLL